LPLIAKQVGGKFTEFKIWVISPKVPSGAQNPPFPTINLKQTVNDQRGGSALGIALRKPEDKIQIWEGGEGNQCFIGNFVVRHQ